MLFWSRIYLCVWVIVCMHIFKLGPSRRCDFYFGNCGQILIIVSQFVFNDELEPNKWEWNYHLTWNLLPLYLVCMSVMYQDGGGEMVDTEMLGQCSLDLTQVNRLLSVLSRRKQLLEQVIDLWCNIVLITVLISAPSLRVYYFFVVDSVYLSVWLFVTNIACSFLFLDGIEPFLGHQFSMTKTTKLFSSIFDLGPLKPLA